MNQAPQEWIETVGNILKERKLIALGNPPPFPFQELSNKLKEEWGIPDLLISFHAQKKLEHPLEGFGKSPQVLAFELTPLKGKAFWMMSETDMSELTKLCLSPKKVSKGLSDKALKEGFYLFLGASGASILNTLNPFGDLSLILDGISSLGEEEGTAFDISLEIGDKKLWGRVFCPKSFLKAFHTHFEDRPFSLDSSSIENLNVEVSLKIGNTTISSEEWGKVAVGDLVLLENCHFDPKLNEGHVSIELGNKPLFQGTYKDSQIHILEHSFYEEDIVPVMEEEEISLEDEDADKDHLWESGGSSESIVENIPPKKDSLHLRVELERLNINLEKLLSLGAEDTLELSRRPEFGVDITLNDKKVAKAEILKIGETIGLKILELE